jgi:gamma-glutamyl hercynylcysteine S-oxide synthase
VSRREDLVLATQTNATVQQPLLDRIFEARRQSDEIFGLVRTESTYERPIPERHRIVFYLGHLEAFDWNLLHENVFGLKSFHPELDRLFAFGIDPVGGGLPVDKPSDWPSLQVVHDYVRKIRFELDEKLINEAQRRSESRDKNSFDIMLNVAIEHRLMHIETLAYMLHQLPFEQKIPQASPPLHTAESIVHHMIEIPAGTATLGLPRHKEIFGWDNEFETYTAHVPAFEIDQYMVTNRHYLDFMAAGGYENQSFWSDADWNWKISQRISHPVFWKKSGDRWFYRTMFDEIPLPHDWPVYVSHAEAAAFAHWAGKSLPTEEEWHRAAYGTSHGIERFYPWGEELPDSRFGNFDFHRWDPAPVHAFSDGQSAFGVHGMLGNGWEWTSTVFAPFSGFEPFPFYRGYSADFFDGKHFVMKGGSARTAACMLRPTFRNWFQTHYQYVYAGFRCVNR